MTCPKSRIQLFFTILILQICICEMGMKVRISELVQRLNMMIIVAPVYCALTRCQLLSDTTAVLTHDILP